MKTKSICGLTLACLASITFSANTIISMASASSDVKNPDSFVTIDRDTFGTPHIYAQNNYDLFYGYGFVLAEDRLYQLDMLRRSTQGKVAEVLGAKFIAFDKKQRTLFWPADIQAQISHLDDDMQKLFKGFTAGINSRIAQVRHDPENLLPLEFSVNDFQPELWTDYDVGG